MSNLRSGIGASQLLKAHDIQQVVDLPGVGENYLGGFTCSVVQNSCSSFPTDHNLVILTYHTTQDEVTLDEVFSGTEEIVKRKLLPVPRVPVSLPSKYSPRRYLAEQWHRTNRTQVCHFHVKEVIIN